MVDGFCGHTGSRRLRPSERARAAREEICSFGPIQIFRLCSRPIPNFPRSFGKYIIRSSCTCPPCVRMHAESRILRYNLDAFYPVLRSTSAVQKLRPCLSVCGCSLPPDRSIHSSCVYSCSRLYMRQPSCARCPSIFNSAAPAFLHAPRSRPGLCGSVRVRPVERSVTQMSFHALGHVLRLAESLRYVRPHLPATLHRSTRHVARLAMLGRRSQ